MFTRSQRLTARKVLENGSPLWLPVTSTAGVAKSWTATFGLERRFGASLKDILQRFPSAARLQTHVLPIRPLGGT